MSGPSIEQLAALAAKGVPEAKMLLSMKTSAVRNQDEQDRRWRNLAYAIDALKEQGKEPQTCQEYLEVFAKYGWVPAQQPSAAQRARKMRFDQLMAVCGGVNSVDDYPAKGEPDAPAKCEGCRQQGAGLRCSWCGEYYCSQPCFIKDMRDHMPVCTTAVENMHCGMPPTKKPALWSAQQYAKTFGLLQPAAAKAATGSSSSSSGGGRGGGTTAGPAVQPAQEQGDGKLETGFAAMTVAGGGRTKAQKRRAAKKRQKEREQKAAAEAAGSSMVREQVQPVVAE